MSKLLNSGKSHYVTQTLQYGNERIPYQVFFTTDFTHKIKIDVLPAGVVQVIAPETASLKQIKDATLKRARWIYNHVNKIKTQFNHVLPREYVSGESHHYLGRRYVLKVFKVKNIEPSVKLLRGQIQVRTKSFAPEAIRSLLSDYYRKHAEHVFERRLQEIISRISWLKQKPNWKMRVMKKQWGSCSPKGTLTLNPLLVKAPKECVDYVILHELCHLKEHNHSKKYYRLLSQYMPEWERIKARLDDMSELLLAK